MVKLQVLLFGALVISTGSAAPLQKRIAQVIADSTAKWEKACLAAGGGEKCNPLSVAAFTTLLAAAGPCDQQDAADNMIDLAKTLQNNADVISLTQIFAQQPRNTPTSQSVQYCQKASRNSELNGLFQCQFQGANPTVFVGGVAVGQPGTIPLGLNAPLSPPGSCPAHTAGPIPDGQQLSDLVSSPGNAGSSSSQQSNPPPQQQQGSQNNDASSDNSSNSDDSSDNSSNNDDSSDNSSDDSSNNDDSNDDNDNNGDDSSNGSNDNDSSNFQLANGQDAQALNAKFAGLSADSSCNEGEDACINGGFAQCVSGKFVVTGCAGGTQCFALPLVNSRGTSITCDTQDDALARIADTGATGGLTGDDSDNNSQDNSNDNGDDEDDENDDDDDEDDEDNNGDDDEDNNGDDDDDDEDNNGDDDDDDEDNNGDDGDDDENDDDASGDDQDDSDADAGNDDSQDDSDNSSDSNDSGDNQLISTSPADFHLANGQQAQALNKKFAGLTASSSCTAGEDACINGQFAQCVGGKFAVTGCAGGLQCFALPLVNKPGTSVTCDTQADALARISETGATGGLNGN